ncbi:signal recognition particle-docking protein FtsY [Alkalibacter saccharofermentans]|uniref:Signal recognition particle receptor FtsY n=1 Tax=Alkalibacter saccharofermentans DSM 14828 TaxID=1120975 RepID=A0A1M4S5L8_9FIRM|nr:signal recognition particle-docking protein FtsY [Alkalibacter saccharofermentans]SHE27504.1 signal recognition particle-docking protein FtsY [Alkalibacter saccharofermentans DSM 14828]
MAENLFEKLKNSLVKTKKSFTGKIDQLINYSGVYDEEFFEELEEILILSDIGYESTNEIIEKTREIITRENITDKIQVKNAIKLVVKEILKKEDDKHRDIATPAVILIVGVNGVGKTTTIAKLANLYKGMGLNVMLAAGDTFRAAAVEQLEIWAERVGVPIVKNAQGADPSSVIFDALQAAKSRKTDILICDTAGRLHNKDNLMKELSKMNKIINNSSDHFNVYRYLVLDATSGTNALNQTATFNEVTQLDGIILTKLDGSAKGGIIIPIKNQYHIPVEYVGVGEGVEDLQEFIPEDFAEILFE